MKSKQLLGLAIAALAVVALPAQAADVDVGVSIGISQPGVYGRIDIGRFPQPQVIVQQPVIITRQARAPEPVYLWVPPGHQKKWSKHCSKYQACGVPVYFVQESWYHDHVLPPEQRGHPGQGGKNKGKGKDKHD